MDVLSDAAVLRSFVILAGALFSLQVTFPFCFPLLLVFVVSAIEQFSEAIELLFKEEAKLVAVIVEGLTKPSGVCFNEALVLLHVLDLKNKFPTKMLNEAMAYDRQRLKALKANLDTWMEDMDVEDDPILLLLQRLAAMFHLA